MGTRRRGRRRRRYIQDVEQDLKKMKKIGIETAKRCIERNCTGGHRLPGG